MKIQGTKSGRVRCPECNKLQHPFYDDEKDVMVLECCKTWSLFPTGVDYVKRLRKPKVSKKNVDLLKNLKDYHYGKKEQKEKHGNADGCG